MGSQSIKKFALVLAPAGPSSSFLRRCLLAIAFGLILRAICTEKTPFGTRLAIWRNREAFAAYLAILQLARGWTRLLIGNLVS